jgi:hypothetical protein
MRDRSPMPVFREVLILRGAFVEEAKAFVDLARVESGGKLRVVLVDHGEKRRFKGAGLLRARMCGRVGIVAFSQKFRNIDQCFNKSTIFEIIAASLIRL